MRRYVENSEVFRVVTTRKCPAYTNMDGVEFPEWVTVSSFGPYMTLASARGVATSERNSWRSYDVTTRIEKALLSWEVVE